MSLASWKREFYRKPADEVIERNALKHSLKKWTGLLSVNRRKHQVTLYAGILTDKGGNRMCVCGMSCALCRCYDTNCEECPLVNCGKEFTAMLDEQKVSPMIRLLKKSMKKTVLQKK